MAEPPPVPDPTVLTTEQLLHEADWVNKLVDSKLAKLEGVFEEKFSSVKDQFDLVERQRVEQKKDTKDAVDAAFSAAKEAVKEQTAASDKSILKSETSTSEQLKQLDSKITAAQKGTDEAIAELKTRVSKIEDTKSGAEQNRTEHRDVVHDRREALGSTQALVYIVVAVIAAAGLVLGLRSGSRTPVAPTVVTVTTPTK